MLQIIAKFTKYLIRTLFSPKSRYRTKKSLFATLVDFLKYSFTSGSSFLCTILSLTVLCSLQRWWTLPLLWASLFVIVYLDTLAWTTNQLELWKNQIVFKDINKEHTQTVPFKTVPRQTIPRQEVPDKHYPTKQYPDKKYLRNIIQPDTTRKNQNQTELPEQTVGRQTAAKQITSLHRQMHLEKTGQRQKVPG